MCVQRNLCTRGHRQFINSHFWTTLGITDFSPSQCLIGFDQLLDQWFGWGQCRWAGKAQNERESNAQSLYRHWWWKFICFNFKALPVEAGLIYSRPGQDPPRIVRHAASLMLKFACAQLEEESSGYWLWRKLTNWITKNINLFHQWEKIFPCRGNSKAQFCSLPASTNQIVRK